VRTARLEAFSDAVIAIAITIMVLEMKVPPGAELSALRPLLPVFISYGLSFLYLAIYWNNHHHLLQATERVSGAILWANMHLLFWLSLFPFVTGWLGENRGGVWPTVTYGLVLLMAALAYFLLERVIVAQHGGGSAVARAIGRDVKGLASLALYAVAIALAFVAEWAAQLLFVAVALLWFVPDRRIEAVLRP
jgi:uncharacterized membrane protein